MHRAVTYGCTVLSAGAADLARQPIGTRGEAARACDLWSGEAVAARPGPSTGQLVYVQHRLSPQPPLPLSAYLTAYRVVTKVGSDQTFSTMVYCSIVGPYPF